MQLINSPLGDGCLTAGGETGALLRATDWNHTPLGPVEAWPSCLRAAVGLMLASNLPTSIVWGPEQIQIYNDAYRGILGAKHPAIGRSVRDAFPEVWFDTLGPMLGEAMQGNPLAFDDVQLCLERDGFLEERFFDLSFAPVADDLGAVGGVQMTVRETTVRVVRERRLEMLAELAESEPTSTAAVWSTMAEVLSHQGSEVPFVAFFSKERTLVVARGVDAASIDAADWPFGRELTVVSDVRRLCGDLVCAPWPEPVRTAVVVPIADAGFLVVGVSPRRTVDDRAQDHWKTVAGRVARSIARARAYEEQVRRAIALKEVDRAKTAFFSDVSHEFRTPITLMLGPMDRALVGDALTGEDLRVTHRNALRLLKLVNTLLDFASIEAGRMRAFYEPVEIGRLTAELAAVFRSAIERAGLHFEVDTPPLNEPVFLDREMYEKIVLNLLSNAFKFTFDGTIGVRVRGLCDGVELTVHDTGEGIAPDQLPELFTRFHRVTGVKARSRHGSGIGLALVHELVKLHGGTLRVDSQLGKGSRFTATFRFGKDHLPQDQLGGPRRALSPVSMSTYAEEAKQWLDGGSPEVPTQATTRILVVDDNRDMREYLRRILSGQWHVITVSDGAAALESIRRDPPDLVLADVMMPGLDGFELLKAMRADKRTKAVPFVMLSARAGEEARIEGFDAGVDDYLIKPFSARELVSRVKAQLRLLTARREAELQKQQLHALFMQAPTPIAILRGPDHTIELANGPTCQVWGRRHDELIGRPLFEAIPELRDQAVTERLERVRSTGVGYVEKEMPAMFDRQGNGTLETAYFNFVYEPLRNIAGAVEGVLIIAFEVTDEVVSRQNMESLRAEAEGANRAKDEFLAMLGHELRNPLSPIVTALELMSLRAGADNRFQRERQVIERQLGHLIRLVDDLLDVSRIARGKMELKRQPVEIGSVVAKAIELASPLVERRDHRMRVHVPPSGLCVSGDEHRLAQVVANLLTNAAKYTSAGGEIEVRAYRDEGEAVISVRDNGSGIAPEFLPRVFDLFAQERVSPSEQSYGGGLGLGLAIVRNLVNMHDGSVSARSEGLDRGSEFIVRLPLLEGAILPLTPALPDGAPEVKNRLRVLVVDDNVDSAQGLAGALRAFGYSVRVAHDGPSALTAAREFKPLVGLIDIGLPAMDGYEVALRMRDLLGSEITLIALTAYGQRRDRERTHRAGIVEHLVRPIDLAALGAKLSAARALWGSFIPKA